MHIINIEEVLLWKLYSQPAAVSMFTKHSWLVPLSPRPQTVCSPTTRKSDLVPSIQTWTALLIGFWNTTVWMSAWNPPGSIGFRYLTSLKNVAFGSCMGKGCKGKQRWCERFQVDRWFVSHWPCKKQLHTITSRTKRITTLCTSRIITKPRVLRLSCWLVRWFTGNFKQQPAK